MVMDDWISKFRKKSEVLGIKFFLLTKYVDNVIIVAENVKLGSYWNVNKITWSKEVLEKHTISGMNRSNLTLDVLRQIANTIIGFL